MRAARINESGVVVNFEEVDGLGPDLLDPDGAQFGSRWDGNAWRDPEPVQPTREELKAARDVAVSRIAVTVGDKVFDGDEKSQERMSRALRTAEITGLTSCQWVMRDNSVATVTKDEIAQALALAMQAQGALWFIPE
jgi:hypothetical protein